MHTSSRQIIKRRRKIGPGSQMGACHQNRMASWASVATLLRLWLASEDRKLWNSESERCSAVRVLPGGKGRRQSRLKSYCVLYGNVVSVCQRLVKGVFIWKPSGTRTAVRPRNRWEVDAMKDLKLLKIKNWTKCIQNRREWRRSLEKVKTFKEVVLP
jgi:hypothetical protein